MRSTTITETLEPAQPRLLIEDKEKAISVCAYCRVSTDKRDQANSFKAQKDFFEREFSFHENWRIKTIFADNGISGTSYKNREEFLRMISAAERGEYQLILTKGVSRFSRNVIDSLSTVTKLREKGVFIWFMTENIYTENPDYREQLTKASEQAEAESRNTSRRVKWGQRYCMQQGVVFGRKEMFGYNIIKDENNQDFFQIIEDEAEIVRRIFKMYADGMGTYKIARQLEQEGRQTKRLKKEWSNTVILRMLRNERYVGDLMQGKTYTPDFLTHEKKYNRGESAKYYRKNNHEGQAIVSRDLWDAVQSQLKKNEPTEDDKKKHSNRYWCSGKVFCGECGSRYISHTRHLKNGGINKTWKCWENQLKGHKKAVTLETGESAEVGCSSQSVNDRVLKQGIHDILEVIIKPQMEVNFERMKKVISERDKKNKDLQKIQNLQQLSEEKRHELSNLVRAYNAKEVSELAYKVTVKEIEAEIQEVEDKLAECNHKISEERESCAEIERQLENLSAIAELKDELISEDIFRSVIDKIVVCNDHILKYYIAGWAKPIVMKYKTEGKMEKYTAIFEIINA